MQQATLLCPACGQPSPPGARFCDSCGTGLLDVSPEPEERVITIGREADNRVVLDYPMVSSHHARIVQRGDGWVIEDLGSTNGTSLGTPANKIRTAPLAPSDTVYFGSLPVPATRLLGGRLSQGDAPVQTLTFQGDSLVLGRDPSATVVLDQPMVSWQHARLLRRSGGLIVEDLGSTNGTFVNGRRIAGSVPVSSGDVIGLGSYSFRLAGLDRIEQRDYRGNVTVEARGVALDVPGRRLLEGVSLTIYPSELVGLMGPSGAGKTTLMSALNGYLRPAAGSVAFNGQDLYAFYDRFRAHIGYVPQDDIMHSDLTVRQALTFTARLRLPTDTRAAEIAQRVDRVLDQLGLTDAADVLIGSAERKGISGGQRKRVNLAMELLTDPFVLFLDEPTSGLSSEDALMVMRLLRRLADEGKTVLLTIHQPSRDVFRLMDSLVLVAKDARSPQPARVVYFGPAYPDAVHFFAPESQAEREPSPDLMLHGLAQRPAAEWAARYATSPQKQEYVDRRAGTNPAAAAALPITKPARRGGVSQWQTLVQRSLAVKIRDRWNTVILLAQAPLIALLIGAVFGRREAATADSTAETGLFLMVLAAIWFGCSNSAREIVGEWAIYRRERMINLGISSYLGSKLAVLGGLCALQCATLLPIVANRVGLQGEAGPMFALLWLAALIGVAMGLLVSAAARSSEIAIALVPLLLLPMVILGGLMQPLHLMEEPVRLLAQAMPSRWAFEGLVILESKGRELGVRCFPPADRSTLAEVVTVCAGLFAVLAGAIALQLRLRDIHGPLAKRRLP